jgi:uncharacterized repeat protein (TIGR01451 family)
MLTLGLGLLGAYFGVRGQDPRNPWPPPPVVPPDNFEASDSPPPRNEAPPLPRPVLPRPVRPPGVAAGNPVIPVNHETRVAAAPDGAAPAPLQVEIPPPAPTPAVDPKPPIVPAGPQIPQPKPGLPVIKTTPEEKTSEPLIVLPPMENVPKDNVPVFPPKATPPNPLPAPPVVPAPTRIAPPEARTVPMPPGPDSVTAEPAPTKLKAFQLVKPRRQTNDFPGGPPLPVVQPTNPERPLIQAYPVAQAQPHQAQPHQAQPQSSFPGPVPTGNATPQVTVEKRGPTNFRAGDSMQFFIILRNIGATPAHKVRVEDDIPPGAKLTYADPQPVLQSDRAVWTVPTLPAGAEKQLKMELQSQNGGEIAGTTSVVVSASTGTKTRVKDDVLSLVVKGPATVPAGFPVVFEVQVTNHGKQAVTGLVLHGRLPAGLSHPAGKEIEADVGDIGPGAMKTFKMPVTAVQSGRQAVDVKISTPSGLEATGQGSVQVTHATGTGLSVRQAPSTRLYQDKVSELRIEVTNHQDQGLTNVAVLDALPDGVEFIGASDRGLYRPDTRTAHWLIDHLAPGQTQTLSVRVQARTPGQFDNEVNARTEARQETRSTAKIHVRTISDLALKVADYDGPIEVGKPTTYEIKVTNQGSAPATGVQVQANLPEGLTPAQAQAPRIIAWTANK